MISLRVSENATKGGRLLLFCLTVQVTIISSLGQHTRSGARKLSCMNENESSLFYQEGECCSSEEAVWYYDLVPAPISSNGLEAGAPTHFHLLFGSVSDKSINRYDLNTSDPTLAMDPEKYGLNIPGGKGNLTIELSPHFIFNHQDPQIAQGMWTTEMGLGPANIIFPSPCVTDADTERGQIVCAGWYSNLDPNDNQTIVILAPDGLYGRRAQEVGVKFFHLHPVIELSEPIYFNANGTCSGDSEVQIKAYSPRYCRFNYDCPNVNETCIPASEPLTGSVTATVYDENGNIYHKATRSYTFDPEPHYRVSTTNTGLACNAEVVEMVDFQRVEPNSILTETKRHPEGDDLCTFSEGRPYAPRFFLFGPSINRTAFPQQPVSNLTAVLDDDTATSGKLYIAPSLQQEGQVQIGTFELIQPENSNGKILQENLGFVQDGPARIGGTIFAIPMQVGYLPGTYAVKVTVGYGNGSDRTSTAVTRIIVPNQEVTSLAPTRMASSSWCISIMSIATMATLLL